MVGQGVSAEALDEVDLPPGSSDLHGRVAVVTGASAGIGRACALALAAQGADVLLVARREAQLAEVARLIVDRGGAPPQAWAEDVTQEDAAGRVMSAVEAAKGRLDILVTCAGGSRTLPLGAPERSWREAMELNFHAVRRFGEAAAEMMVRRSYGRIVNITGTSEPRRSTVYGDPSRMSFINAANSAKAAVHAWAKGLSREVGRSGVTVNCIAPGVVASEQVRRIYQTEQARHDLLKDMIPLGRLGGPQEVAALVAFLASEAGSYISGEIIHVDGGLRRFAF